MAKREPTVSWRVLLDDDHWEQETPRPAAETARTRPRVWPSIPRRWLVVLALLLAMAVGLAGFLLWQRAQNGLALMQAEIEKAALLESTAQSSQNPLLAEALLDPLAEAEWRAMVVESLMEDDSAAPLPAVERVELTAGVSLVHLTITDPDLPQPGRVVRFYREQPSGWLRTSPVASSWGAVDAWRGEYFVFRFQERDRGAVLNAAPRIEETYIDLRTVLGLPLLAEQQVVVVGLDDRPLEFDYPSQELRQPSPQLLLLPVSLRDEEALFRSLTIYLINDLVRESFDRYAYGEAWMWSSLTESGLRNWLLLESGVVQIEPKALLAWLLDPAAQADRRLPEGLAEECQWVAGIGAQLRLLGCTPDLHTGLPIRDAIPRLSRLTTTYNFDFSQDASASTNPSGNMWRTETRREISAFTSLYLYAAERYGRERMADLLEALGDYRSWPDVLPAAYGVSVEEFEEGWRAWLVEELRTGK